MSAEDRVRTAAEATAASVRQVRPLLLPDGGAIPAGPGERRGRRRSRRRETLMRMRDIWLIPLGAAAVVVMVAVTLMVLRHPAAPATAGPQAPAADPAARAAAIAAVPRYYATAYLGKVSHEGKAATIVTVADARTGATIGTVDTPPVYVGGTSAVPGISATADDRSFVVGTSNIYGGIAYYLVRVAPGAKQAVTIGALPIPQADPGDLLAFAVSPDGQQLATLSYRGNGTTLRTYSTKTGATQRTWTAAAWKDQDQGGQDMSVSWTADGSQVAFTTTRDTGSSVPIGEMPTGPTVKAPVRALTEHLISASAPNGDLAAESKAAFNAPSSCHSLLLTPDGGTVVCGTQVNYQQYNRSPGCEDNGPMLIAYSVATGRQLRVLYQYSGTCYTSAVNTVLWADASARHVVAESDARLQGNSPLTTRYGAAATGIFAKIQIAAPLSQWNAGPAF